MGEAICARAGEESRRAWYAGWRGYDHVGIHKVDTQMNVMVAGLGLPLVVDALSEASVDLPEDVLDRPLGGVVVGEVERGGVDEGEVEDLRCTVAVVVVAISGLEVDVD